MADARNSPIIDAIEALETSGAAAGTAGSPSSEVLSVQGVSGGTRLPVNLPQFDSVTYTASVAATGAWTHGAVDVSGYQQVSVQVAGTFSATVTPQISNDGTNWFTATGLLAGFSPSLSTGTTVVPSTTIASPAIVRYPTGGAKYFRLNCTAYTSGTATVTAVVTTSSLGSMQYVLNFPVGVSDNDSGSVVSTVPVFSRNETYAGALLNVWGRARHANVFKTATATASGDTALWTPTSGRKFNILGGYIQVPAGATSATAEIDIVLRDNTTALPISASVSLPSVAPTLSGAGGVLVPFNLGPVGLVSGANDRVLNINLSAALTASKVRVVVWGTEE